VEAAAGVISSRRTVTVARQKQPYGSESRMVTFASCPAILTPAPCRCRLLTPAPLQTTPVMAITEQ
jgi:hypothetical protein